VFFHVKQGPDITFKELPSLIVKIIESQIILKSLGANVNQRIYTG
jgi:hypothetical protein